MFVYEYYHAVSYTVYPQERKYMKLLKAAVLSSLLTVGAVTVVSARHPMTDLAINKIVMICEDRPTVTHEIGKAYQTLILLKDAKLQSVEAIREKKDALISQVVPYLTNFAQLKDASIVTPIISDLLEIGGKENTDDSVVITLITEAIASEDPAAALRAELGVILEKDSTKLEQFCEEMIALTTALGKNFSEDAREEYLEEYGDEAIAFWLGEEEITRGQLEADVADTIAIAPQTYQEKQGENLVDKLREAKDKALEEAQELAEDLKD